MSRRRKQKSPRHGPHRPGDTVGGEGHQIREYIGWDEGAGVFRQDDPALRPDFKTHRPLPAEPAPVGSE